MKKMQGVPPINAMPEFTLNDGSLKSGLLKWESPKPFSKRAIFLFTIPPIPRPPSFVGYIYIVINIFITEMFIP